MRRMWMVAAGLALVALLGGCGGNGDEAQQLSSVTSRGPAPSTATTARPTTTTTPPPPTMPSGDPAFDGYPHLVPIAEVDSRVASWFDGDAPTGELVAVAPGVYTPYNPNITDLTRYLSLPNAGDCAMRQEFFPTTGGSCWPGVQ